MKILLFSEGKKAFSKSGVGRALKHQMKALDYAGVKYTLNPNENYDLAHINTIGLTSSSVLRKSKKANIPVIYHTHTTFEDFRNSFILSNALAPVLKKQLVRLYSRADRLISPSEYTKGLVKSYGIDKKIDVVSNGIDTGTFMKNVDFASKFRKEFGLSKPTFISVGFPFERKGVHDFCQVAEALPEFTFIWFGAKITPLLPSSIKKLIKNPPTNVIFPGFVPTEILMGAYSGATAFFFPSYEENEGIVVLEALSMKCPVVIRDIPVYYDWMKDSHNCFKGRDNNDFVRILNSLAENSDSSDDLIARGRETALERDLHRIGDKLKSIYEETLDTHV